MQRKNMIIRKLVQRCVLNRYLKMKYETHIEQIRYYHPLRSQFGMRKRLCLSHLPTFTNGTETISTLQRTLLDNYLDRLRNEYLKIQQKYEKQDSMTIEEKEKLNLQLRPVVMCVEDVNRKKQEIDELKLIMLDESSDKEMRKMAAEELAVAEEILKQLESTLIGLLLPKESLPVDQNNVILEVTAGVGGQEAMLFAQELFNMYQHYSLWKGWRSGLTDYQESDLGGLRHASMEINGQNAYLHLKFEAGVHRVQRVPITEKSGRVHTSTAAVAVFPQPSEINININQSDLKIETKRSSGAGGQHVNKTESAIRMTHIPTGIVVECQEKRSQIQNREVALRKLRSKIYQIQYENHLNKMQSSRKIQIGTSGRSEKIRTYNFNQDRITDHRLQHNFHNLDEFLVGNEKLDRLITSLVNESQLEILMETIAK